MLATCADRAAIAASPPGAEPISLAEQPATPEHVATTSRLELPTDSSNPSHRGATAPLPGPGCVRATEAAAHGESADTVQRPHVAVR
jgi:hypothetical protein